MQWGREAGGSGVWDRSGGSHWAQRHRADTPRKPKHRSHQRLDFLSPKGSLMWMPFACSPGGEAKGPPSPMQPRERRSRGASPSAEHELVFLFAVRNDVDKVFVIQVARYIWREGCKHLIDLPGKSQGEKVAQKGFVAGAGRRAGGLSGWRVQEAVRGWEGVRTSSWENLSPCVISISLMLQTRECGEHQGGLGGAPRLSPWAPLHSLGGFQAFPLWIKHLERIQDRLLWVSTCRQHGHGCWRRRRRKPAAASCFPQPSGGRWGAGWEAGSLRERRPHSPPTPARALRAGGGT